MMREPMARRIFAGLLFAYTLIMVYLLFLQRTPSDHASYNYIPLDTIRHQIGLLHTGAFARFAFINLAGNVVMFIPLGLLPGVWEKQRRFGIYLLTVALAIALVELLQLLTMLGSADIDDWLLNMIGAVIGFEIWRTIGRFFRLYK